MVFLIRSPAISRVLYFIFVYTRRLDSYFHQSEVAKPISRCSIFTFVFKVLTFINFALLYGILSTVKYGKKASRRVL